MSAKKRLGILYGRLGLATDASLIESRAEAVKASSGEVELADIPRLIRVAFGLPKASESGAFLQKFSEIDPTFSVQVGDREAALLAATILDCMIESEEELSPIAALAVETAAAGGHRRPLVHDGLLEATAERLVHFQGDARTTPADRIYSKQPAALTTSITAISQYINANFTGAGPHVVAALQEIGKYAEANALAAARSDRELLTYIAKLESELRLYWWVSGGWSTDAARPFRKLGMAEAALRSGKELADKAMGEIGLFSAPALLDMLLERGRPIADFARLEIKAAATACDLTWRQNLFLDVAASGHIDLLPISAALGLAAESGDAEDWQPRFERITSIAAATEYDPIELGMQLYHERLLIKALS